MDHDDDSSADGTRKFSTIYASGYVSIKNLHYVSEIHIIPDYNTQIVDCVFDPRHIVERTIAFPTGAT